MSPWVYVVISVGSKEGGWAVLLPPRSAARVAEGAWIGPDVQHFADQLLRILLLPGHCLTFWYSLTTCGMCPEHWIDVTVLDVDQASKGQ